MLKITARKIAQSGKILYQTAIKAGDLINEHNFKVHFWDPNKDVNDKDQGYQRELSGRRSKSVAKYLRRPNAILPTSILLSARKPLPFNKQNDGIGELSINQDIYVVDGQHRVAGLRQAIEEDGADWLKDMEIPAIILDGFEKIYEVTQFFTLNDTQKKVPTDLSERLITLRINQDPGFKQEISGDRKLAWKPSAVAIVDGLNKTSGNPWYQRIKMPNDKSNNAVARQVSFVSSLKRLLQDGGILSTIGDLDLKIKLLINYWGAIETHLPDAFADPKEYVIQKTPGLFSLHSLLAYIIPKMSSDYSKTKFIKVLEPVFKEYRDDFWRSGGKDAASYNSMKSFGILTDLLREELKEVSITV